MRDWSLGNHRAVCPKCSTLRKKKKDPCLSVTVNRDGSIVFFCHHCEWAGCMGKGFERLRGKERRTFRAPRPEPPKPPKRPPRWKFERPPEAARRFFRDRGISTATVNAFRIGVVTRWMPGCDRGEKIPALVFPYFLNGRVVNHKYRAVERKSFIQDAGTLRPVYNLDATAGAAEVVIVEGEMDVLALHEAGFPATVTLPDGAARSTTGNERRMTALSESGLPDRDIRFILAGDTDEPGRAMRDQLISTLGADRCRVVDWPGKDGGDCLRDFGISAVAERVGNATPLGGGG